MSVNSQKQYKKNNLALAIALFLFLFSVYLLTYTPRINSSDGLAMFATAESLVRRAALDIEQIRWMDLQQGTYGLDGLLYSRKGIGVPVGLLPLTWLGLIIPWFGPVSTSLLFNAIVTALTAVLILAYLQELGYTQRTGLIVALTFGLSTLAWPYAKSLFSDPFSGLLLLAAAYTLLKFKSTRQMRYPFLAGLFLGWNVATRYAEALFLVVFGLLLLFTLYALRFSIKKSLFAILAFAAPILAIGIALITFNISRYGDPLSTGYLPNETFSAIWLDGILGQLFSPGRGLLLYCPILILSIWGFFPFFRRFKAEAVLALSIILIHLLLYGKWFMWHGGYAWGPRFMVPTLPFWAIFLAPLAKKAFRGEATTGNLILRVAYLALFVLGLIPQFLGVIIDFAPFQNSLLETGLPLFARETFFSLQYSAFVGAWGFIAPNTLDLAWAWQGQGNWTLVIVLIANSVICGVFLWQAASEKTKNGDWRWFPVALLTTLTAMVMLLGYTHRLPSPELQAAVNTLNSAIGPSDIVITNDPKMAMPFAELYKGRTPVLGLNNGGFPLPDTVSVRLNGTIAEHRQIWWLPNWLPPEESAIEQILRADTIKVKEETFGDQRLLLFVNPPAQTNAQPVAANFGELVNLSEVIYPHESKANTALPIELRWQAVEPVAEDYHVFIHLLDREGQIVAQTDGQPAQWTRPTSSWAVGETVVDRHGLWIPANAAPGSYQLAIGMYQPATGERLPLLDQSDTVRFPVTIN